MEQSIFHHHFYGNDEQEFFPMVGSNIARGVTHGLAFVAVAKVAKTAYYAMKDPSGELRYKKDKQMARDRMLKSQAKLHKKMAKHGVHTHMGESAQPMPLTHRTLEA